MGDPYVSLKGEVEVALKEVAGAHNWTSRQIEDALQRVQWDVDMLEESVDRVSANPDKYRITNSEVDRRRDFVRKVRKQITDIRSDLTGGYAGRETAAQRQQREDLMGSRKEQEERQRAKNQVNNDNQDFMDGENLRQQLIVRQQDEHLDDLHSSVTRIGEMGLSIHTELKEQEEIVDDLQSRTDFAIHNMADVNKQVEEMLKSKEGRKQICLIITLIGALMLVTSLIFFLP